MISWPTQAARCVEQQGNAELARCQQIGQRKFGQKEPSMACELTKSVHTRGTSSRLTKTYSLTSSLSFLILSSLSLLSSPFLSQMKQKANDNWATYGALAPRTSRAP